MTTVTVVDPINFVIHESKMCIVSTALTIVTIFYPIKLPINEPKVV